MGHSSLAVSLTYLRGLEVSELEEVKWRNPIDLGFILNIKRSSQMYTEMSVLAHIMLLVNPKDLFSKQMMEFLIDV